MHFSRQACSPLLQVSESIFSCLSSDYPIFGIALRSVSKTIHESARWSPHLSLSKVNANDTMRWLMDGDVSESFGTWLWELYTTARKNWKRKGADEFSCKAIDRKLYFERGTGGVRKGPCITIGSQWQYVDPRKVGIPIENRVRAAASSISSKWVIKWTKAHLLSCSTIEEARWMGAGKGEELDCFKWVRAHGCVWDETTCAKAALGGHFSVLIWARDNGCRWDGTTCSHAALGGHLVILKWARSKGCPWDGETCSNAAKRGYFEILKWATENGCPPDPEHVL